MFFNGEWLEVLGCGILEQKILSNCKSLVFLFSCILHVCVRVFPVAAVIQKNSTIAIEDHLLP